MISKRKRKAILIALGAVVVPLILSAVGCAIIGNRGVAKEERETPRDPATGIILGAEERNLGPENSKSALLVVHGFIGDGSNFNDLPERMAARGWFVRVILLPGHGTSPRDFAERNPDEFIAKVRSELAALRAKHAKVAVVTHSMGAAISTLAVAEEGADALIWGAPYFGVSYKWFYVLPVETWAWLAHPVVHWVYRPDRAIIVHCPEARQHIRAYRWIPTRGALTLMELGRRAGKQETLDKIKCPVLWMHSPTDAAASPEAAQEAYDKLKCPKQKLTLDNSDHHIYWDCQHDEVMAAVENFLGPAN
ncbi:alpha/beta fold hydrolase [Candidatus Sumerlaeota bacterium]|nr:alpha/beta fold hydrolase [Candidatus Sumerlaeota bacterium]